MSDEIKNALTEEEWRRASLVCDDRLVPVTDCECGRRGCIELSMDDQRVFLETRGVNGERKSSGYRVNLPRHPAAALCLYWQPFGFTQEDVALLHELRYEQRGVRVAATVSGDPTGETDARIDRLLSLASRIAALLPPPEAPEDTK